MKTAKLRIDPSIDYTGMFMTLNMPFQPLPQRSEQPTALEMSIDLLCAKIQAATEAQYTPSEIEFRRRREESARLRAAYTWPKALAMLMVAGWCSTSCD